MRKLILLFLMLAAVALTGCLPQAQANPTSAATTITRAAPSTLATVPTKAVLPPISDCTIVTKKPTPGPTAESIYPPISTTEWVKGPESAKVTIIEYSDFQ
jgi:hypothetical protein